MRRERSETEGDDRPPAAADRRPPAAVRVAVYAGMAELLGGRSLDLPWSGGTVADLRAALAAAHPRIASLLSRSAVAVGNAYARDDAEVPVTADVAIIPPVSGG